MPAFLKKLDYIQHPNIFIAISKLDYMICQLQESDELLIKNPL